MTARHSRASAAPAPLPIGARVARRNALALAAADLSAALALGLFDPGISPALGFLWVVAPLWLWALAYLTAGVLLVARQHLAGHSVAAPLWVMLAVGAVYGLATGSTRSPAGSVLLAGVVLSVAGLHTNAMTWRRRERAERRAT